MTSFLRPAALATAALLAALPTLATPPCPPTQTVTFSKVVELSQPITEDIPLWPGDPAVELTPVATIPNEGYYLRRLAIGEHSATHMNAPNSFIEGGADITSYSAAQRVVQAVVIDIRSKTRRNADYQLSRQDVLDWERTNGRIPAGAVVLLRTGWAEKWGNPAAFFNEDADGNLHFPGFAPATTTWLLAQRQIGGVGTDTHGVDPGLDVNFSTNAAMAENHLIALECLNNLGELPAKGATLILAPLQLKEGSGSPASIIALVP